MAYEMESTQYISMHGNYFNVNLKHITLNHKVIYETELSQY